jgi:hypothetical protein
MFLWDERYPPLLSTTLIRFDKSCGIFLKNEKKTPLLSMTLGQFAWENNNNNK